MTDPGPMTGRPDREISRRHFLKVAGGAGIAVTAAPLSGSLMAACSKSGSKDTLKVGVMAPFSGIGQFVGDVVNSSLDAAVKQLNATKGVGGRKVELLLRDTADDPAATSSIYRELSSTKDILGILWCGSMGFYDMLPQIGKDGLPVIAVFEDPLSAGQLYPQAGSRSLFQMSVPAVYLNRALADYARNDRGYASAAMIYDAKLETAFDPAGSTAQRFQQAFSGAGLAVAPAESFATGDTDFGAQLGRLRAAAPQVLVLDGLSSDTGAIAAALDTMGAGYVDTPTAKGPGWQPHVFGSYAGINQLWDDTALGAAKVGSVTAWHVGGLTMLPSFTIARWLDKYVGKQPVGGEELPANGLATLLHGLKKAGTADRQRLVKGIETMGQVTFASTGFSFSQSQHGAITPDDIVLLTFERLRGPAPTDPPYQLGVEWQEGGPLASLGSSTTLLVRPTLAANRRAHGDVMNQAVQGGYGTQCTKQPDGTLNAECKIH